MPFAWFTADEAFGQNPGLRDWLQDQDIVYVMATRNDDEVPAGLHTLSPVKDMIAGIRAGAWQRMSCGDSAHGPRVMLICAGWLPQGGGSAGVHPRV